MKAIKLSGMTMAFLAIVVGVAVFVSAFVALSGVLTINNHVIDPSDTVKLTPTAVVGTEFWNTNGTGVTADLPFDDTTNVLMGQTYGLGITMTATKDWDAIKVMLTISSNIIDLSPSNVTIRYWEVVDSTWHTLTLTDDGNTLSAAFGPAAGFPVVAGATVTSYFQVTYNVAGDFQAKMQAVLA